MSRATPLHLDSSACDRCLRCLPVCAPKALRIGPGYVSVDWDTCTGCGKCAAVCDRRAIELAAAPGVARHSAVTPTPVRASAPMSPAAAKPAPAKVSPVKPAPVKRSSAPSPVKDGGDGAPAPRVPAGLTGTIPWGLPEAGLALLVAFALLVGEQALPGGLANAPLWAGVTLLVYDAVFGLLLWYLAHRRGTGVLSAFRFDAPPAVSDILRAVGVALACWLFSVSYRAVALGMGLTPPASDGVDLTRVFGTGLIGIVATVAVVALLGPLLEEVMLRGVVLGAVARKLGVWPATLLCALAFALLHASMWSLLPLTVLGIGLGWLATRSRSLWPAVVAHVIYNLIFVAAAFYAAR